MNHHHHHHYHLSCSWDMLPELPCYVVGQSQLVPVNDDIFIVHPFRRSLGFISLLNSSGLKFSKYLKTTDFSPLHIALVISIFYFIFPLFVS